MKDLQRFLGRNMLHRIIFIGSWVCEAAELPEDVISLLLFCHQVLDCLTTATCMICGNWPATKTFPHETSWAPRSGWTSKKIQMTFQFWLLTKQIIDTHTYCCKDIFAQQKNSMCIGHIHSTTHMWVCLSSWIYLQGDSSSNENSCTEFTVACYARHELLLLLQNRTTWKL
jgi:hypothetical protein